MHIKYCLNFYIKINYLIFVKKSLIQLNRYNIS